MAVCKGDDTGWLDGVSFMQRQVIASDSSPIDNFAAFLQIYRLYFPILPDFVQSPIHTLSEVVELEWEKWRDRGIPHFNVKLVTLRGITASLGLELSLSPHAMPDRSDKYVQNRLFSGLRISIDPHIPPTAWASMFANRLYIAESLWLLTMIFYQVGYRNAEKATQLPTSLPPLKSSAGSLKTSTFSLAYEMRDCRQSDRFKYDPLPGLSLEDHVPPNPSPSTTAGELENVLDSLEPLQRWRQQAGVRDSDTDRTPPRKGIQQAISYFTARFLELNQCSVSISLIWL